MHSPRTTGVLKFPGEYLLKMILAGHSIMPYTTAFRAARVHLHVTALSSTRDTSIATETAV